jgi:hypothetical protein
MRFPSLRHWISGTAILGGCMTLYGVLVGFVQMPQDAGAEKWLILFIGIGLSLAVWYSLAASNERDEKREKEAAATRVKLDAQIELLQGEITLLLQQSAQLAATLAAMGPQILEQFEATHGKVDRVLIGLQPLYEQRNIALKGTVRSIERVKGASLDATATVSGVAAATGVGKATAKGENVSVAPGTGALNAEGFAPTIEALNQEIREKEEAVLKHLRIKLEPGIFRLTGFPMRLNVVKQPGSDDEPPTDTQPKAEEPNDA